MSSTVAAAEDQLSCDLGGEAAILNLKNGLYYRLDPVGARISTLLINPQTVNEIRDDLLKEYQGEPDL